MLDVSKLEMRNFLKQGRQCQFELNIRQLRSETMVYASAEGQRSHILSRHIQAVRIGISCRVPVCRTQGRNNKVTFTELLVAKHNIIRVPTEKSIEQANRSVIARGRHLG